MESGWGRGRQNCLNRPPLSTVLERYEGWKFRAKNRWQRTDDRGRKSRDQGQLSGNGRIKGVSVLADEEGHPFSFEHTPVMPSRFLILAGLLVAGLSSGLLAATTAAEPVIRDGLGEGLATEFIRLKRMEWVEYSRHVSEWERDRYVEFF